MIFFQQQYFPRRQTCNHGMVGIYLKKQTLWRKTMANITIPDDIKSISFEDALEELEKLVSKMENGGLPLEELMISFERGKLLSQECRNKLASLEKRIMILSGDDGSAGQWQEFNETNSREISSNEESIPF